MKNCLTMVFLLLGVGCANAQSDGNDTDMRSKINALFPNAKNLEWSKKGPRYEVDFVYHNHSISMTFNKKGNVIKSSKEIDYKELPAAVRNKIENSYGDYKCYFFLENDHKGKIDYEIEVMKGKKFFILDYSSDGELLSKNIIQKSDINSLNTLI